MYDIICGDTFSRIFTVCDSLRLDSGVALDAKQTMLSLDIIRQREMPTQIVAIKPGQSIYIGNKTTVKVLDVQGLQVRVEVNASGSVTTSSESGFVRKRPTAHPS